MVEDGAFSKKLDYVDSKSQSASKLHWCNGSRVTAILLNGLILPV